MDLDFRNSMSLSTFEQKHDKFSSPILTIGCMIVLFHGVYLFIPTTLDLDFHVLGKMSSKLIVVRHLFASVFLTLIR